jgi:hypothetical protein
MSNRSESDIIDINIINLLLTLAYKVNIFGFVITGVKPSYTSFIILPILLFRFISRLNNSDDESLSRLRPGLRLFKEVLLLRLRRLRKPFSRALAVSGPKLI